MVGFDDIPAFFAHRRSEASGRCGACRCRRSGTPVAISPVDIRLLVGFDVSSRTFPARLGDCRASFCALKRPGCLIGVRVIFLFRSKRRFLLKMLPGLGRSVQLFGQLQEFVTKKGRKNYGGKTRTVPQLERRRGGKRAADALRTARRCHRRRTNIARKR